MNNSLSCYLSANNACNLFHRFRDTAVDYWLGEGCSVVEIAAMLGDTVPVVERHYRKLLSARMKERLAKIPTRSWGAHV
jgi:integrase